MPVPGGRLAGDSSDGPGGDPRSGRPDAQARGGAGRPGDAEPSAGAEIIELFGPGAAGPERAAGGGRGPRRLRRTGLLLVGCGLALLPWLAMLAATLPASATAAHWALAWVGLDTAEAVGLIGTGLLAARGDTRYALTAAATAALLAVDAWFDTVTAAGSADLHAALAMAAFAELPLAALCTALAVRALRPAG